MHPTPFRPRPTSGPRTRLAGPSRAASLAAALLVACAMLLPGATAARAELLGQGPILLGGWSGDDKASGASANLGLVTAGWRWRWQGADFLDEFFAKAKTDFSWSVEAQVGGVFGDEDAFEAGLLPQVRFAPLGWETWAPYFEGGIGLEYTSLSNYGLGSQVLFTDDAGVGITFGGKDGPRWSVGYRFRHLSHAGIFGSHNDGLNAHFLAITVEL